MLIESGSKQDASHFDDAAAAAVTGGARRYALCIYLADKTLALYIDNSSSTWTRCLMHLNARASQRLGDSET